MKIIIYITIYIYIYIYIYICIGITDIITNEMDLYPMRKKQQQEQCNAQFRCNLNSELCIRLPLLFYTWGT